MVIVASNKCLLRILSVLLLCICIDDIAGLIKYCESLITAYDMSSLHVAIGLKASPIACL